MFHTLQVCGKGDESPLTGVNKTNSKFVYVQIENKKKKGGGGKGVCKNTAEHESSVWHVTVKITTCACHVTALLNELWKKNVF